MHFGKINHTRINIICLRKYVLLPLLQNINQINRLFCHEYITLNIKPKLFITLILKQIRYHKMHPCSIISTYIQVRTIASSCVTSQLIFLILCDLEKIKLFIYSNLHYLSFSNFIIEPLFMTYVSRNKSCIVRKNDGI